MDDSNEIAKTLLKRHRCLDTVVSNPSSKRTLVEDLEIPRSTLDNIMRELDDSNLVTYSDG